MEARKAKWFGAPCTISRQLEPEAGASKPFHWDSLVCAGSSQSAACSCWATCKQQISGLLPREFYSRDSCECWIFTSSPGYQGQVGQQASSPYTFTPSSGMHPVRRPGLSFYPPCSMKLPFTTTVQDGLCLLCHSLLVIMYHWYFVCLFCISWLCIPLEAGPWLIHLRAWYSLNWCVHGTAPGTEGLFQIFWAQGPGTTDAMPQVWASSETFLFLPQDPILGVLPLLFSCTRRICHVSWGWREDCHQQ